MDIHRFIGDPGKSKHSASRKDSTSVKDLKKKLSCINKRISDLHHQRKVAYKNSVKVKKMIRNQINQIVKCFNARERIICSDVDEIYSSQVADISDELSKLQLVHAQCQALFNHIEDFKDKSDIFKNIDNMLSEINFDEKPDVKSLEFVSDFETMKVKASSYGNLEGDFVKKDDFIYVGEEIDEKLSASNCKLFQNKELFNQVCKVFNDDAVISSRKSSSYKTSDCDDFQIIDLLDNMNCQDIDNDFVMEDDVNLNCALQTENKLSELSTGSSGNTCKAKEYNTSKKLSETCNANIDFNPDEEWKHIIEMNKKLASWQEVILKETVSDSKEKEKSHDKNSKSHSRFLLLKEADSWLHSSKNCNLSKDKTSVKITKETNSTSPAEIIQKSFKPFFTKDNIQNWLYAR